MALLKIVKSYSKNKIDNLEKNERIANRKEIISKDSKASKPSDTIRFSNEYFLPENIF